MDAIAWMLDLKVGDEVGVFAKGQLLYKEHVKFKDSDGVVLGNKAQFDEYGDEVHLTFEESDMKQYIGPIQEPK